MISAQIHRPLQRTRARLAGAMVASLLLVGVGVTTSHPSASINAAARRASSSTAVFTFGRQGSLLTRSINIFNPNYVDFLNNVAMMQLAFDYPLSLTKFYPELAKSMTISGQQIKVTLQSNDEWTNHTRVTSQSVMAAFMIEGISGGNNVWMDLENVTTPTPTEIVFTVKSGFEPVQLLTSIATIIPVPGGVYDDLLPGGIKATLLSYYSLYDRSPAEAAKSAQGKELAALDKKIVAFTPKQFVSDGPYRLESMNTSEILLHKWKGFWDARQFKIPTVVFEVLGSNSDVYPAMLDDQFDETLVGMPKLIAQEVSNTPYLHLVQNGDGTTVKGIFFNTKSYPFTMLGVRKALAEVINRSSLVQDVWGVFKSGAGGAKVVQYPSPISPTIEAHYLTKAQIHSLNPYRYNVSKATATLKHLGFHRSSSGGWIMPNGKPFDVTILAPSGWSGPDLASIYLETALGHYGIKTQAVQPSYEEFYSEFTGGQFQLAYFWSSCCEITNPLDELTLPFDDYDYSSPTEPGTGLGPVATIPGIGKVNVPATITKEAADVPVGSPEMSKLVYDWVRFANAQLPVYDIGFQTAFSEYSTKRFTDFPPNNSPIWRTYTQGSQGVLILAMQEGYIHPRT